MPDVSGCIAHREIGRKESKRGGKGREKERANEKRKEETVSLDHSPTKLTGLRVRPILKLISPLVSRACRQSVDITVR